MYSMLSPVNYPDFILIRQDATAEDLARCDNICIICREDMQPTTRNKRLNCGHVFHMHCLR